MPRPVRSVGPHVMLVRTRSEMVLIALSVSITASVLPMAVINQISNHFPRQSLDITKLWSP